MDLTDAKSLILIVDDAPANIRILSSTLLGEFEIAIATSGADALDAVADSPPDLILLDVMMPAMDAYEVCRRLKADPKSSSIPVIFLTGQESEENEIKGLELGAVDYITKPFSAAIVKARIRTQLRIARLQRDLERTNTLLEEAQDKIAGLVQSSSQAIHDVAKWAETTAGEIARTIGVDGVEVWVVEEGTLSRLTGPGGSAPRLSEIQGATGNLRQNQRETLVPIAGVSGTLLGTLVIPPRKEPWAPAEERLVVAFAHQLGSTLELKKTQQDLALASEKRGVTREQLLSQGIELLHVCEICSGCFPHTLDRCPEDGGTLESPPGFLPYRLAGRYRLERILGDGGMGTVFSANDERLARRVAVKVIKLGKFSDAETKLRFEQEAHAVAQLDHSGVIVIHDTGEVDGGAAFLVMELLQGKNLGELILEEGPGTPRQVALLLRQTGGALAAAHRRNIVHRDIKPENIFLVPRDGSFQAKVLDFGLAKTPAGPKMTQTGMVVGTPQYMSPEQARGESMDARSDLYSLAVVAFYALTGEAVVKKQEGILEMLMDVAMGFPPLPSSLISVSRQVDQAFLAAFAKDPARRPGDIEAWANGLAGELEKTGSTCGGWDVEDLAPARPRDRSDAATKRQWVK